MPASIRGWRSRHVGQGPSSSSHGKMPLELVVVLRARQQDLVESFERFRCADLLQGIERSGPILGIPHHVAQQANERGSPRSASSATTSNGKDSRNPVRANRGRARALRRARVHARRDHECRVDLAALFDLWIPARIVRDDLASAAATVAPAASRAPPGIPRRDRAELALPRVRRGEQPGRPIDVPASMPIRRLAPYSGDGTAGRRSRASQHPIPDDAAAARSTDRAAEFVARSSANQPVLDLRELGHVRRALRGLRARVLLRERLRALHARRVEGLLLGDLIDEAVPEPCRPRARRPARVRRCAPSSPATRGSSSAVPLTLFARSSVELAGLDHVSRCRRATSRARSAAWCGDELVARGIRLFARRPCRTRRARRRRRPSGTTAHAGFSSASGVPSGPSCSS